MPTCHGCHGPMGQGQHQGSAPGKAVCSLRHSMYCRGGVIEDLSWKACPPEYQYNPNLDMANGPGFESTLDIPDFHSNRQQLGPTNSTPLMNADIGQHTPAGTAPPSHGGPYDESSLGAISRNGEDRFPSRVNLGEQFPTQLSAPGAAAPLYVDEGGLAAPQYGPDDGAAGGQQAFRAVPENIQNQIDSHRASNQVENVVNNRPDGMNIQDLRRDPDLRNGVENYLDNVIRQRIPSLSSAPTAQMNGGQPSHDQAPHYAGQTVGDGIRITGVDYQPAPPVISAPAVPMPAGHGGVQGAPHATPTGQAGQKSQQTYPTLQPPFQQQPFVPQTPHQQVPDQHPPLQPSPAQQQPVSYRTEFRCSPTSGRQWQVQVPLANPPPPTPPPQFRNEWRIHPHTGTTYQVQVPIQQVVQPVPPPQQLVQQILPPQHFVQPVPRQQVIQPPQQLIQPPQQVPSQQMLPQNTFQQSSTQHFKTEWRIHPQTGTPYQAQIPVYSQQVQQSLPAAQTRQAPLQPTPRQAAQQQYTPTQSIPAPYVQSAQQPLYSVQQQASHGAVQAQDVTGSVQQSFSQYCDYQESNASLTRNERVAGIVSLLDGGGTSRKQPKVLDFAKRCPVRWSKQATMSNINLPLYAWGSVAELEASLAGRSEAMPEGVMLGKIRHLQNVLEVCCLSSSSTDYTGYSWTLARDYASKVDNEVDQKLIHWQNMQAGVRTATLVSSQMEHPRPPPPARGDREVKGGKVEKKELCTTYNKCKTDGKCEYEVTHPGKTCQRKHECSYCREKKKQSWRHQAWACQNKPSEG